MDLLVLGTEGVKMNKNEAGTAITTDSFALKLTIYNVWVCVIELKSLFSPKKTRNE